MVYRIRVVSKHRDTYGLRPEPNGRRRYRLRAAWLVLIGKADAVVWE